MTPVESATTKNILSALFRRKGKDGLYTRAFDSFGAWQQHQFCWRLRLGKDELPIIGSFEDWDNWLVLTTERLVWAIAGSRQQLRANAIDDAIMDLWEIRRSGIKKTEFRQLQVVTMDGSKFVIEVEPGTPLIGVWHVLRNLGCRNRARAVRS